MTKFRDTFTSSSEETLQAVAASFRADVDYILKTKVGGSLVPGEDNPAKEDVIGQGGEKVTVGGLKLSVETSITDATALMASSVIKTDANMTKIDTAISWLQNKIAEQGVKANFLSNRQDLMNSLSKNAHDASDAQVVTPGGSASSVLGTLLA